MRYWCRKTIHYGGMILFALVLYGSITLLWSLLGPWKNYQWNESAIRTNGTIMEHEIREFPSQDGDLYAGYISVKYNNYWSQLCAVEDTVERPKVEQILLQNYSINSNVTIYYQSSSPSDPHLGPKSILAFVVWCVFNAVILITLMIVVAVVIYRDHKNNFHEPEHIRLYSQDDIRLNIHATHTSQPEDNVKFNNYIPSSYNL